MPAAYAAFRGMVTELVPDEQAETRAVVRIGEQPDEEDPIGTGIGTGLAVKGRF
jgi:hypothetical protein